MVTIHSNNYLIEYCRQPGMPYWMKSLVYKVIAANAIPTETEIAEVVSAIQKGTVKAIAEPSVFPDNVDIKLMELTHHSGVNALAKEQTLKFGGEGICLVFGRSGSGKSGYFRILHKMTEGRIDHPVIGNIHQATPDPIDVDVICMIGRTATSIKWTGGEFNVPEFKYVSVFDSVYAKAIIEDRTEDSIILNGTTHSQIQAVYYTLSDIVDRLKGTDKQAQVETILNDFVPGTYVHQYIEALKSAFEDELEKFGIKDLKVEIKEDASDPLKPKLQVRMPKNKRPEEVLSEGEQKCIAIAMFLAERDLQPGNYPMVFDDPLNSLDVRYISMFASRIIDMPNQVIVFSHQVLFKEELVSSKGIQMYSVNSPMTGRPSPKRHLFVQRIVDYMDVKGVVVDEDENSQFFLKEAETAINSFSSGPKETMQKLAIGASLRRAIELLVDEKVFKNLMPNKYKSSGYINWQIMRKMSPPAVNVIDELEIQYGKLSSHSTHVGTLVPLELPELRNIYNKLKSV